MSNKALIIKAPSSINIDADILRYDVIREYYRFKSAYSTSNGITGKVPLHLDVIKGDDVVVVDNDTTNVKIKVTKEGIHEVVIDVSPIEAILSLGMGLSSTFQCESITGEGLDSLEGLTNITEIISMPNDYMDNYRLNGDIANLKGLTNLTNLDLRNTSVMGDIANLKGLTNLTNLVIQNTSVMGDIANLKGLTNLTDLDLQSTSVMGDIVNLKGLKVKWIKMSYTKVYGDLSQLTNLKKITLGKNKISWSSSTARSSVTNIPLQITQAIIGEPGDVGNDLDNLLIDEAACTNYSGNSYGNTISIKGNRTSASDAAIKTLQDNGWTLRIYN